MTTRRHKLYAGLLGSMICSACIWPTEAAQLRVTDDSGKEVRLERPARRIISLSPHITENLFAAGAGQFIAGTVSHSDYPAAAQALRAVGNYHNFDVELILSLQPDLVIAWQEGNQFRQVERLEQLGFPIYVSAPRQLTDIARDIRNFGLLAGTTAVATARAQAFLAELGQLRQRRSEQPRVSIFYQIWNDPLITVTDRHVIGDVIRLCGGSNIFATLDTPTPRVALESVLTRDPQIIVAGGMTQARPDWLDNWNQWPMLTAVRRGNLYAINPDLIQRYTTRILQGANRLCDITQAVRRQ